jgi:hypothetical protein
MDFNFWTNHYYWFYSTVAQSAAAFIGIIAVFAVFRLQLQHDNVTTSFEKLRKFMLDNDQRNNNVKIVTRNKKELLDYSSDLHNFWANQIVERTKTINSQEKNIEEIISKGGNAPAQNRSQQIIDQNRGHNTAIHELIIKLEFFKRGCREAITENNIINGKALFLTRRIAVVFLLSLFVLFILKYFVADPLLSHLLTGCLIMYILYIGIKLISFLERSLKGDFLEDAFKDAKDNK